MSATVNRDPLGVLGGLAGTYLVLVAIATVVGTPWQYVDSGVAAVLQVVAAVLTLVLGAGLAYLSLRV